jgi:hypothetical protein
MFIITPFVLTDANLRIDSIPVKVIKTNQKGIKEPIASLLYSRAID